SQYNKAQGRSLRPGLSEMVSVLFSGKMPENRTDTILAAHAGQVKDGVLATLGELLADEAVLHVVPHIDRGRRAVNAEVVALLHLAGDGHLLDADVGQFAADVLAGVAVEHRHVLVVEASLGDPAVPGR